MCQFLFYHTHTLGSNSTATFGPSVELITFAAISWIATLFCATVLVVTLYLDRGKQFKTIFFLFQPWTQCLH